MDWIFKLDMVQLAQLATGVVAAGFALIKAIGALVVFFAKKGEKA